MVCPEENIVVDGVAGKGSVVLCDAEIEAAESDAEQQAERDVRRGDLRGTLKWLGHVS